MRSVFQDQLAAIEQRIAAALDLAIATLEEIGDAVADTAAPTPSSIERNTRELRDWCGALTELAFSTIARQAPVAGDLRLVLVLMEIAHHSGLVANQFDLVSSQLMEIDPEISDALGTGKKLANMAKLAGSELAHAAAALSERDADLARRVARDDGVVNQLNREVFSTALLGADGLSVREVALRHVLIARSLERIGDNAVDIAEQAAFLATGQYREFTDASHTSTSSDLGRR